jgi:hypothetical protein
MSKKTLIKTNSSITSPYFKCLQISETKLMLKKKFLLICTTIF